jgi:hypothetical protein
LVSRLRDPNQQPAREQDVVRTPRTLAIYYGYPSLVNGAASMVQKAASEFERYDVVVFGAGLELGTLPEHRGITAPHPDHANTRAVIAALRSANSRLRTYGYIAIGNTQQLPVEDVRRRVALWSDMGVHGIFLDEAGYDFGVTRRRLNESLDAVHDAGLSAFVNAYNPDDVFSQASVVLPGGGGNPSGEPSRLQKGDLFLLESFQIKNGAYEDAAEWFDRTRRAMQHRANTGVEIFSIATSGNEPYDARKLEYAWWSAVLWSLDGFGWGEAAYASDSTLPWRSRPSLSSLTNNDRFVTEVQRSGNQYWRDTMGGRLVIDTALHTATFTPH